MTVDVCVLAGGLGTRLRGVWDGPKCLVPVGGVPLLERLLRCLRPLTPRKVALALGYRGEDVQAFIEALPPSVGLSIYSVIEADQRGTAAAFRRLWESAAELQAPILVLNGDTLPLYDLASLVHFHASRLGAWSTAAMANAGQWREVYAGAAVLSDAAARTILADDRTHDFQSHLVGSLRYQVRGFLDVGTPEGFKRAQDWQE